jgi:hypothetical protein
VANEVTWDASELTARIKQIDRTAQVAIGAAMEFHASRGLAWARQNAPWTDRTTNARNSLFARTLNSGKKFQIIFGHGVPYGIWLEVRFAGRYQIIRPTVQHEAPEVMVTVATMMSRMWR